MTSEPTPHDLTGPITIDNYSEPMARQRASDAPLRNGVPDVLVAWARQYTPEAPVPDLDPTYYLDTQVAFIDNVRYRHTFGAWASGRRYSAPDNVAVRRLLGDG